MPNPVDRRLAATLLERYLLDEPEDRAYRSTLQQKCQSGTQFDLLQNLTGLARSQLIQFAQSRGLLRDFRPLEKLVIIPTPRAMFRNIVVGDQTCFAVSQGFVDLLTFHHRATVALRMADRLAVKSLVEVGGSPSVRHTMQMAHFDLIGRWLVRQFELDDLPAANASPGLHQDEQQVFLQGMIFLLMHEEAHSVLNHRSDQRADDQIIEFPLVSPEALDRGKRQELAADAWAAKQLSWPRATQDWSIVAVVRLFLVIGIGQAANGRISASHPYVSNRLSHLIHELKEQQLEVRVDIASSSLFLAKEHDLWKARRPEELPPDFLIRSIGAFSVEAATLWVSNGGDRSLLS